MNHIFIKSSIESTYVIFSNLPYQPTLIFGILYHFSLVFKLNLNFWVITSSSYFCRASSPLLANLSTSNISNATKT